APAGSLDADPEHTPGDAIESARGAGRRVQPSRLQLLVARRMAEAKATIPHFQVQTEVAMDAAIALRAQLKQLAGEGGAGAGASAVPSLNDMVVKATALAQRRHPLANASYRNDRFELHEHVNVGIAVATGGALIVPAIRDADRKSLGRIASEARALAGRVRDGASTAEDLAGGTFTVSNLGMFGVTAMTPVINAPQAAILGVGALREVLVRVDGEIVDRTLMTLTLSCDHRILYGADAARFLGEIRQLLEVPLTMAL
ncbi:MAG TPA: dihydrolipoamide acetyltransferase family protein, partial [Conexibacter sp.]|nr:dihydrolipoamide acetyltransferase family protein [Conexibacter sp.]